MGKKNEKILIITSSGGGGLLQAAKAKQQEILSRSPEAEVMVRNIMEDWIWPWLGKSFVEMYNTGQRRGNLLIQRICTWAMPAGECIFWLFSFFHCLKTLFTEKVDRVLDTQVMGTAAIIKAIRIYNFRAKKKVFLEKVIVDMPTAKATHFLGPIRKLSASDRKQIRLATIKPLLRAGETESDFWQMHCRLGLSQIHYEDLFVRSAFLKLRAKPQPDRLDLCVSYQSQEELNLIFQSLAKGSIFYKVDKKGLKIQIDQEMRVISLLLGSQPAVQSTLRYVKNWIELARAWRQTRAILFVFCSKYGKGESSLLRAVSDLVANSAPPRHLTIVPLSFQNEEVVAPLFARSDITCTRSGGQTAMEVMCVLPKSIWIHSEAKKRPYALSNQELLDGIPGWESANAAYLQQKVGARLVTPDTFMDAVDPLLFH